MSKIIYDVEVEARVRQWYTVEASSLEEARQLVLSNPDGDFPVSEEVLESEIINIAEEFDQEWAADSDEDWDDDDEPQWLN